MVAGWTMYYQTILREDWYLDSTSEFKVTPKLVSKIA